MRFLRSGASTSHYPLCWCAIPSISFIAPAHTFYIPRTPIRKGVASQPNPTQQGHHRPRERGRPTRRLLRPEDLFPSRTEADSRRSDVGYSPTLSLHRPSDRGEGATAGLYNNQHSISGRAMTEFARSRSAVDDTDLLCVEVSGLGAGSSTLPRVSCGGGWHQFPSTVARTISSTDHTQEDFLSSLLLKTDAYRPRQQSLTRMQDTGDESYYLFDN